MAIRTYTGTLCRPNLADAKIELYCFQVSKLERGSRVYIEGEDPEDEDAHEYLVINYLDGRTEIYRNSFATMFIL